MRLCDQNGVASVRDAWRLATMPGRKAAMQCAVYTITQTANYRQDAVTRFAQQRDTGLSIGAGQSKCAGRGAHSPCAPPSRSHHHAQPAVQLLRQALAVRKDASGPCWKQLPGPMGAAGMPRRTRRQRCSASRGSASTTLCVLLVGDHRRSATAAAAGQARSSALLSSTNSPQRQASPPRTRSSWRWGAIGGCALVS